MVSGIERPEGPRDYRILLLVIVFAIVLLSDLIHFRQGSSAIQKRGQGRVLDGEIISSYPGLFNFDPVDVNSGDKKLLMTIPGIGPKLAQSIIQYRQDHGVIEAFADLQKVPGIGIKKAENLRKYLSFPLEDEL